MKTYTFIYKLNRNIEMKIFSLSITKAIEDLKQVVPDIEFWFNPEYEEFVLS